MQGSPEIVLLPLAEFLLLGIFYALLAVVARRSTSLLPLLSPPFIEVENPQRASKSIICRISFFVCAATSCGLGIDGLHKLRQKCFSSAKTSRVIDSGRWPTPLEDEVGLSLQPDVTELLQKGDQHAPLRRTGLYMSRP